MPSLAELLSNTSGTVPTARSGRTLEELLSSGPAPIAPEESAWESFLRHAGLGGYGVRNLLTGNLEGFGRNVADFVGNTVDATLPGDWIPQFSRQEDLPEGSDLLRKWGVADLEPGIGKLAADIGIGLVTDPLTYLGVGVPGNVAKGGAVAAKAGAETAKAAPKALTLGIPFMEKSRIAIPGTEGLVSAAEKGFSKAVGAIPAPVREKASALGRGVRSVFGATRAAPWAEDIIEQARTLGGQSAAAQEEFLRPLLAQLTEEEGRALFRAIKGYARTPEGAVAVTKTAEGLVPHEQQVANIVDALRQSGIEGDQLERLSAAAQQWVQHTGGSFRELVERGAFTAPEGDLAKASPQYVQATWERPDAGEAIFGRTSRPKASKAAVYRTPEEIADAINRGEQISEDLVQAAAGRASQQPQMLSKATAARGMVERFAKSAEEKLAKLPPSDLGEAERYAAAGLTDAEQQALAARGSALYQAGGESSDLAKAANSVLKELSTKGSEFYDPETAEALRAVYEGLKPREGLMKVLAGSNRLFKKFATAGAFIPRLNFSVRNVLTGGTWQALSNPQARPGLGALIKEAPRLLIRSMDDGLEALTGTRLLRSENEFAAANEALRQSGGVVDDAIRLMPDGPVKEAFEDGVILGGFIDSEQLGRAMSTKGWKKWIRDLRDWPAEIAKGSEQRMRFAVYKALRDRGIPRQEAARTVMDTFFDYSVSSAANRAARDVIPFFQFTAKSIPQTLKFLKEQPAVAGAIRPLYTQDDPDRPVPPWMSRMPIVPVGESPEGDPQYLTSFGLPFETLGTIPNLTGKLGDILPQIRQGVVGQANPALKTAIGALSGTDPYFGTPFGSYDKAPELLQALGVPERGDIGRLYQALAGTGAIQPFSGPVNYLSGFLDQDKSSADALLSALTGSQVRTVDEDQALRQIIQDQLRRNPAVGQFVSYYQNQDDPDTQALIDALNAAKKRIRERRKAEAQ